MGETQPFYVNTRLQPWEVSEDRRRQGAVSAFGFSGTNAHVVVGEYLPPVALDTRPAEQAWSSRTTYGRTLSA